MSLRKHFTGTSGIASAAILNHENENFQFPTLEPGFDLLSDDWFQVNVTETGKKQQHTHSILRQRLLNRWTSQLDLGCTTGGLERVVSVHNST